MKILIKIIIKIQILSYPLLIFISNCLVYERIKFARKIRAYLLRLAGVNINGSDIFIDRGFKALIPSNLYLDEFVSLGHDNAFWCFSPVRIGSKTQTAKDLLIIAGSHDVATFAPLYGESQSVVIGPGCWIGARVTILGGTVIGHGSVIAAGAVVKGIFPPLSIIGGVPAKLIKQRFPSENIVNPFGSYRPEDLC